MKDLIKKLTGKNQNDYEQAAAHIIDNADVKAFEELVSKDDFLFDFIKQNVAKRLMHACNQDNFKNLLEFTGIYSPSYDEFIAKTLVEFGNEDITNIMLELLDSGNESQKAYSAKYFCFINNEKAIENLKKYAYNEFEPLALNCAAALASMNERSSIEYAVQKLDSDDDFEVLSAVKFISAYGDKNSLDKIFEVMKKSAVSEYIAGEIGYMVNFTDLLETEYHNNTLLAVNEILQGLGEIVSIGDIFTFKLYEVFERLIYSKPDSKNAVVLLNAKNKFNLLTENDEYLFDEDKSTKEEVFEIKNLLNSNIDDNLDDFIAEELNEESDFIYSAIELIKNPEYLKPLLNSKNPTVVLKSAEALKMFNCFEKEDKEIALKNISSENIKSIIMAL